MFCTACGTEAFSGARHCYHCGAALPIVGPPSAPGAPVAVEVAAAPPKPANLVGVRGWLLLLCLGMSVVTPLYVLSGITEVYRMYDALATVPGMAGAASFLILLGCVEFLLFVLAGAAL